MNDNNIYENRLEFMFNALLAMAITNDCRYIRAGHLLNTFFEMNATFHY